MVSVFRHVFVVFLAVGVAHAEDEAKDGGSDAGVKSMLDSLPEIAAPKAKAAETPKPKKVIDFNGYNRQCSAVVMPHFKAPKGAVKKNPEIELELLVQVDADGRVLGVGAGVRSGDKGFDKAAIKALNKAGDLPRPPHGWDVNKDRVLLLFKGR